jgi:hypothetical protein
VRGGGESRLVLRTGGTGE